MMITIKYAYTCLYKYGVYYIESAKDKYTKAYVDTYKHMLIESKLKCILIFDYFSLIVQFCDRIKKKVLVI